MLVNKAIFYEKGVKTKKGLDKKTKLQSKVMLLISEKKFSSSSPRDKASLGKIQTLWQDLFNLK